MNIEYINKSFYDRYYIDMCSNNDKLCYFPCDKEKKIIQDIIQDFDIYRQILIDWETKSEKELGIKIIFDGEFKIKWSEQIQESAKEEIKKHYFSKRIEILKIILLPFNDFFCKPKYRKNPKKIENLIHFKELLYEISNTFGKNNNKIIESINFENNLNIYKNIIEKMKQLKHLLAPITPPIELDDIDKIDSDDWYNKNFTIKNWKEMWAVWYTEMSDEIIDYENQLFRSFEVPFNFDFPKKSNQKDLAIIEKNKDSITNNKFDVPGDGNCLFWAIANAYLLEAMNDKQKFYQRYCKLFGKKEIDKIESIKELYKNYDLKKGINNKLFQNDIAKKLVTKVFRNQVVNYIEHNRNDFEKDIKSENISFEDYLKNMRKENVWGGGIEIQAMSIILDTEIYVDNIKIRENNEDLKNSIQIFHVPINKNSNIGNHYNFGLTQFKKPKVVEIKNTNKRKKIDTNSSCSFSTDKILSEQPSEKKQKLNQKTIKTPNFKLLHNLLHWFNNSGFSSSTINWNHTMGNFDWQNTERPTSHHSGFSSSTINWNHTMGNFDWQNTERPTSHHSGFSSSTINSNYTTGTLEWQNTERPTSRHSAFSSVL